MFNPAFIVLILLGVVALWFLASFLYKPLGRFFHRVGKDAIDELTEEDNDNDKEE